MEPLSKTESSVSKWKGLKKSQIGVVKSIKKSSTYQYTNCSAKKDDCFLYEIKETHEALQCLDDSP